VLRNLGVTLQGTGWLAEAEVVFRRWRAARPTDAAAALAVGCAIRAQGRHEEARDAFIVATRLAPELAEAWWDLSLAHLTLGDFAAGWDAYRWRWALPANAGARRPHNQRAWDGQPIATGRKLLLWGEQGVGDSLMFAACIADVLIRVPHPVVEVEARLVPLLARSFPATVVVPSTTPPHPATQDAGIAAQAPLGELAALFRRGESSFLRHHGWLIPNRDRVTQLRNRYGAPPGRGGSASPGAAPTRSAAAAGRWSPPTSHRSQG